ncbi:hypothetical protein JL722_11851 [Aureococcus anophagefferens]|nr:hypothetical protein JL722_11851 [Aureococcus anophagefferens]
MGLVDQLPSDVLPFILGFCDTKQAFENFARTCKALKEASECKKLLVTKRKLVWRDKIVRNEAVLRHGGTVHTCSAVIGGNKAWIYSAVDGALLQTLLGHTDGVMCAEFSADGARVVTASYDRTVRVWDAATGATLMTLRNHTLVYCCAFSPDGSRVVTGSLGGTAWVWDVRASQR